MGPPRTKPPVLTEYRLNSAHVEHWNALMKMLERSSHRGMSPAEVKLMLKSMQRLRWQVTETGTNPDEAPF